MTVDITLFQRASRLSTYQASHVWSCSWMLIVTPVPYRSDGSCTLRLVLLRATLSLPKKVRWEFSRQTDAYRAPFPPVGVYKSGASRIASCLHPVVRVLCLCSVSRQVRHVGLSRCAVRDR